MGIAVITGASSGLGRAYALALNQMRPEIDEYWLIARRADRLIALAKELPGKKTRILALDLTKGEDMCALKEALQGEKPDVSYLINSSGIGQLGNFSDIACELSATTVNLNCTALTEVTAIVLPYMKTGTSIINVSSIAAFLPTARMSVYSATKAYVLAFSRALRCELKARGIHVLAVCPGPMDTEFLDVAGIRGQSRLFSFLKRAEPESVAKQSIQAADKGHAVCTSLWFYKVYRVLCKIIPHSWLIPFSKC